jgi:hypothetical protein
VGVAIAFAQTNAAGHGSITNLTVLFDTSPDGTNWTKGDLNVGEYQFCALGTNGPTAVFRMTNFLRGDIARLNNTYQIKPRLLTNNGGSSAIITGIWWVYNSD